MTTNPPPPINSTRQDGTTRSRRERSARTARAHVAHRDGARPDTVRRRDGVTLAATGRVPARVRARVLADHHAELAAQARSQVVFLVYLGRYPLAIPYGYCRTGHENPQSPDGPDSGDGPVASWWEPTVAPRTEEADRSARAGRAPARSWALDAWAANAVRLMGMWARDGVPADVIASRMTADPFHPLPLTTSGQPRSWTAHTVRAVLADPALTGHSVWGRTRHGQPVPPEQWIVSRNQTHPSVLDRSLWRITRHSLDLRPDPPADPSPAEPWWIT